MNDRKSSSEDGRVGTRKGSKAAFHRSLRPTEGIARALLSAFPATGAKPLPSDMLELLNKLDHTTRAAD
jgi:hypothetical protein